eukprot:scaffold3135_cov181-Skeletonema_marinoi.AAC.1
MKIGLFASLVLHAQWQQLGGGGFHLVEGLEARELYDGEPTPAPMAPLTPAPTSASGDDAGTVEPTWSPTTSFLPTSSSLPSSMPSVFPFVFDGIDDAGSFYQGVISILWDFPHYVNGDIVDLESVRYHILSYAGSLDFKSVLESSNYTAEALISEFEENSWNETNVVQYHLVDNGEEFEFELNTTFYGELHSIIVIAEVDGVYSRNTDGIDVYASEMDPVLKEDVNIVGIFVPTNLLTITINEDNTMIEFDGPVRQEHKDLAVGDYVYGISNSSSIETGTALGTKNEEFLLLVTSVVESSDQRVVLSTKAPKLEDIYDEVDFELAVGMSRPDKVETSPASRHKHRHLIQRRRRRLGDRRLFWGHVVDAGEWVVNGIVDVGGKAFKWIGDNVVEPVAEAVENLVNLVKNGQTEQNFELVAFNADFTYEVAPKKNSTLGDGTESEFSGQIGSVDVKVDVRSDIYVSMKVSLKSPQLKAEAGWRASYSAGFDLTLFGQSEFTLTKNLWEGPKKGFKFFIGPVPVLLDVQPKIDGKFSVKTSSENGVAKLSVGGKGGGHASVTAEVPPKLYTSFKEPDFAPSFKFEKLSKIEFTIGLSLVPSVEVKLYEGAVKGTLSLTIGPQLDTTISTDAIFSGKTCDIFDGLDVSIAASCDVEVGTSFDEGLKKNLNLFEKSWPLFEVDGTKCPNTSTCSGNDFFDNMVKDFGDTFNSEIFLAQGASPSDPPFPSTVYKFEDFVNALKNLNGSDKVSIDLGFLGEFKLNIPVRPRSPFQMWMGEKCGSRAKRQALVNIAAFLGQAMRETIIYDACDENNWDLWNADIYKEPGSPAEIQPAFYPMSSSCGQLGQSYEDYDCEDACPKNPSMEITGSTNADWIGAPPPLFCGPKSKFDGLGYWNPLKFCQGGSAGTEGKEASCKDQPFYYEDQTAGVHIPISEDSQYPEWYYANPIPGSDGAMQSPRFDNLPRTEVEGCCWWGRGVIQTTGRCNFGKLNKNIGTGGGATALYPNIDFCNNPQSICDGPSDLKWIAGCTENPDLAECDTLFKYASGIVNRGCPDPGDTGCPGCIPGATCDPAHNIPERIAASKQ